MNAVATWGLVLAILGSWSAVSHASEDAIESGRRALSHSPRLPWYDAEQDRVARIPAAIPEPPPVADDWQWRPKKKAGGNWGNWKLDWLQVVIYLLLGILLAVVLFFLIKAAVDRIAVGSAKKSIPQDDAESERDRIERLPFPIRPPTGDLLDETRRHADAGRYREAIVYLFSYMLVQLDKHQVIRLNKGKTNRQYLREVRGWPKLLGMLNHAMVMFEDSFFGNHTIGQERFHLLWNRLDEFSQSLQDTRLPK